MSIITNRYEDVKHFTCAQDPCIKHFTSKPIFSFEDINGDEHIFKENTPPQSNISEVFHTNLGNSLDLPCAQYSPAIVTTGDKKLYGVSSKCFLQEDERLASMWSILHNSEYTSSFRAKHSYYFDSPQMLSFQKINLEKLSKLLQDKFSKSTHIKDGVAQNFLMSHVSQNFDIQDLHNLGIILPTQRMAPSFDFERCPAFFGNGFQCAIHPQNVEFLQKTQAPLVENTMDKMRTLRYSANLVDICDFTSMSNFFANTDMMPDQQLAQLSDTVYDTYVKRFDRITDQFTQSKGILAR